MRSPRKHTAFVCQSCGYESPKWLGRCPSCGQWQTMVEETAVARKAGKHAAHTVSEPVMIKDLEALAPERTGSGIAELDRVLGGGLVKGSFLLIGGEPGIGKSTLTLQICSTMAARGEKVLYVSGEESTHQIRLRAKRLGAETGTSYLLAETELESIVASIEKLDPSLLVVDSIQSIYKSSLSGAPGSVGQVRESAADLLRLAKGDGLTTFLVGHVTKFGAIAGPKTLEHMVDTVLYFEGDRFQQYRILRAVKNRFGSTNEIGVFEMTDSGLKEVPNPSEFFLSGRMAVNPGSAVVPTIEGTRPLLVEIQALATATYYAMPQRVANGFDFKRLAMLLCVLDRRAGIPTGSQDVFVNVAGGLRIEEPAADLGIVAAVASSIKNNPVPVDVALAGEVGLGGEVRSVSQLAGRINEAERLGFKRVIVPRRSADLARAKSLRDRRASPPSREQPGIEVIGADTVRAALEITGII
jgi:DNA repair protein RadA/Sms